MDAHCGRRPFPFGKCIDHFRGKEYNAFIKMWQDAAIYFMEISMIRKLWDTDVNEVSGIWLDTNIRAHDFIPARYWNSHFNSVKEMLLQAEVYVYEDEAAGNIQGFIGLHGGYIEGIFVRGQAQSGGIGKQLLDFVKEGRQELSLHVYKKNIRAFRFYQREGVRICSKGTDADTGEEEYRMVWRR